ncbi:Hypp6032 [Branchiostoma lanceolatum]|uniref:Hypp6032 protein n=1 Tax=Branchiostoma lanceolatum TaxID=7740 RepID=A0A8J9YNC0_BRALA|nr:Hypp6032 [Branchiostoma lanceolatum]
MTHAMILFEQHSLQILATVLVCVVIWLFYPEIKRWSYQRRQRSERRRGQALGPRPRPYGDPVSDDEEWLDENHEVFIIASLDWTLDEVERCVRTAVQGERGLTNPDIRTLRISGQDDIDVLNRRLQRNTRVICCANSTTRNILLSDTEHDEISYVVKAAEKIVGGSGVMVLLYGHEKSRDIQQLYDNMSFDRAFLNKQTRLLNKAHRDNLFFSVFKSLNETQKHRLCDWICGNT